MQRTKSPTTCIHLGLPKAASKTLQQYLFNRHPQIECHRWKRILNEQDACDYFRQAVYDSVTPALERGHVPVVSCESLAYMDHSTLSAEAEKQFGVAKVILIVRHPLRWVESNYFQSLKSLYIKCVTGSSQELLRLQGNLTGFPTIEDLLNATWSEKGRGKLQCLRSRKVLQPYLEKFGFENVGVFMFEQLQANPDLFMEDICDFMGVDPTLGVEVVGGINSHRRLTQYQVRVIKELLGYEEFASKYRQSNKVDRIKLMESRIGHLSVSDKPAIVEIPANWKSRIEDMVREDCNYLQEEWGLPIEKYGYPL